MRPDPAKRRFSNSITTSRMRMRRHLARDTDVIVTIRRLKGDVLGKAVHKCRGVELARLLDLWWKCFKKVTQAHPTPADDFAPPLNTLELCDHLDAREFSHISHREQ